MAWQNKVRNNRLILILLFVYFVIHLTNLTLLPIFNDEAIYLDWGWNHTHMPGHLYDALLDAKQPLMIWLFGFFENFFTDPLFAGRFVSVIIGSLTLLGIYKVTKKLLNEKIALLAGLLYTITPIFVFYNRQALMEASIACIGVWSFNALYNIIKDPTTRNGIILGMILGLGFFIKSSSLLFIASSAVIILLRVFKNKQKALIQPYGISLLTILLVDLLLFINPFFWQTFSTNNRYAYSLSELFTFPLGAWISHLLGFFEIGFIFLTPFILIASIVGIFMMKKNKIKESKFFLLYFLFALALEIFSVKGQSQRYLVAFLPFLVVPAAYVLSILLQGNILKKSAVFVAFLLPIIFSTLIIFNPEQYIMQLSKISNYSDVGYVRGQTSGYDINEAMQYIPKSNRNVKLRG